jgi:inorganic pyrophosphatase
MTDFDQELAPGDVENGLINVVVEIPTGSTDKIEWHRQTADFRLDRANLSTFALPTNYGFIPRTLNEDGDELDALIIADRPIQTGVSLQAKLIGIMQFEDEGDSDDKIVVVSVDNQILNSITDIPQQQVDKITHYFSHYKDYKQPNSTKVLGWGDIDEAKKVINKSIWLWDEK